MQPRIVALIGKPLAGKDTQADLLVAAHPESVKISTGHIIRDIAQEGETHRFWPILGSYIPMMEHGLKLPDEPMLAILNQVAKEQIAEGKMMLVFAGSPRSMEQLEGFDRMADALGANFSLVHLSASDEETYRRSAKRSEGRVDDTPQIHKVRLDEYETHVLPMVELLQSTGRIMEIDGMQSKEHVYKSVEKAVRQTTNDPEITLPARAKR